MSSEKIFAILLAFSGLQVCRGAAIGDIARNVRSELVRLDAGLNPQSRRSRGLSLDVPAGNSLIYVFYSPFPSTYVFLFFLVPKGIKDQLQFFINQELGSYQKLHLQIVKDRKNSPFLLLDQTSFCPQDTKAQLGFQLFLESKVFNFY